MNIAINVKIESIFIDTRTERKFAETRFSGPTGMGNHTALIPLDEMNTIKQQG